VLVTVTDRGKKFIQLGDIFIKVKVKVQVKVKVKVKITLEQATKAQSGSRGTTLLFL
jgi:hypothetical protein